MLCQTLHGLGDSAFGIHEFMVDENDGTRGSVGALRAFQQQPKGLTVPGTTSKNPAGSI